MAPISSSRTVSDTIEIVSLRTGQTRTLARIANPWLDLSVAPDRGSLLYLRRSRETTNSGSSNTSSKKRDGTAVIGRTLAH